MPVSKSKGIPPFHSGFIPYRAWVYGVLFALSCVIAGPAFAQAVQLQIVDATADENDGSIVFTVWQYGRTGREITVDYATSDDTAVSGEDYESATGTLTYGPLQRSETVSIALLNDDVQEDFEETFTLTLSNAVNAPIKRGVATGTIVDDEERPRIAINGSDASEGGLLDYQVTLSRSEPNQVTVTVDYATATGHNIFYGPEALPWATPGTDFELQSGTLTFSPGETSKTIRVQTLDDDIDEPVEAVIVLLRTRHNTWFVERSGTNICPWRFCNQGSSCQDCGRILDDDVIELSIGDATATEGDSHLEFVVRLGEQTSVPVTVSHSTSDVTASAGQDYEAVSGSLTFQPGVVRQTIQVPLIDDAIAETGETLVVTLSDPEGATLTDASGTGTITDDDTASTRIRLSTVPARVGEGDGATPVAVTAILNADARTLATEVSVAVAGSGNAHAVDFAAVDDFAITIAAGARSGTRSFTLTPEDDEVDESDETLSVRGTSALPVTGTEVVLVDDDETPGLSVADAAGGEAGGTLGFAVTLDGPSGKAATVSYATGDATAVAGEDYGAAAGKLTFAAGESRRTVWVTVLDDRVAEPDEHFRIELSSPANATLSVDSATGTILDDDADKARTRGLVLVFEPASNPDRQGFVRVINHSDEAGEVLVEAVDDAAMRVGPVALAIGANEARHFNSDDLEAGNADKGLPVGVGAPGVGIWRLELSSGLDVEVLSYARTSDGFVTSLHDTAPATAGLHRAVFLNPAGNTNQVSRLRLVNPGAEDAEVTITGTDDAGGMSADVVVELAAGTAREWTAAELESGTDAEGALGDGDGKWRLRLSSDRPVVALSLIESPTGNLTNLSTLPVTRGVAEGSRAVPLFPSASDAAGRQGFVRVANLSSAVTEVRIEAFDATDWEYDPLGLAADPDEVASFNSDDLEQGNVDKGLTGSTGAGHGDWSLELSSDAEIDVGAYVRTTDGFLTAMHDLVPEVKEGEYRVVFFNPAENVNQVSVLWLVNRGAADAEVAITGVDDDGASPGTAVRTTVPAGSSRRLTSVELESGESDAIESGALGDGHGKWRLRVVSDQRVMVMSLLENPTGHLTNLSTATQRDDDPEQTTGSPSAGEWRRP